MIKKLIKIILIITSTLIFLIVYLSFVGIETEKFNERITNKILEINKKINLDLNDVKFILDPYNFKISIATKYPTILIEGSKLQIKDIKTNVSLKSLIFDEFLIDDLEISTKSIKINDVISLARSFKNSAELFLLDRFIEGGFLTANISLKFDEEGKVKDDYQINGFIKSGEFNFLKQINANNLN